MESLVADFRMGLFSDVEPPCLSLYQPTHAHFPDNQQDQIRFRNLVRSIEESLKTGYSNREIQELLEPFHSLAVSNDFWNHSLDGLAVLRAASLFRVYRVLRPVPELAIVADSFHIKPLLRILQSADRYQVLALNAHEIRLFEGNRDVLREIDLAEGVPRTITQALGEELTEPHQTVASYGTGAGGPAMHHGHGGKKDEADVDAERFFRAVDRAVLEHHSRPSGLPLLLAALPEHHHLFRRVSHNPLLLEEATDVHPDALPTDVFRDRVWRVVEPRYRARLERLVEALGAARSKGLGTDELTEVAKASVAGRVDTLLIEANRQIPGRLDAVTGTIEFHELEGVEVDDLLDDLAELVMRTGGEVVVVPAERMPTSAGLAAIFRY